MHAEDCFKRKKKAEQPVEAKIIKKCMDGTCLFIGTQNIIIVQREKKQPTRVFNHFVYVVISNYSLLYVRDNKVMNIKLHAVNQLMIYVIYLDSRNTPKYFQENIIQNVKLRG